MMFKRLLYSILLVLGFTSISKAYIILPFASELDTIPIKERFGDHLNVKKNPFDLKDPGLIQKTVEFDPKTGNYIITEKIGDEYYRMPTYMTFDEYLKYKIDEQQSKQFQKLNGAGVSTTKKPLVGGVGVVDPLKRLQEQIEKNVVDRLFGGNEISIIPQGNIDLPIGFAYNISKNPALPVSSQRQFTPRFDMDIQMNVTGKIGEKLNLNTSYNSKAAFNFDNQLKLNYDTPSFSEDEIVKDVGAGNVTLPLKSTLIQGASSLFGLKLGTQFGRLKITSVIAQQQSRRQQIQVQQGSQKFKYSIGGDQYDENRHFFLTHSNRENYEGALLNLPQINSLFSITYLEVWVTNDRTETQNVRDIVAFTDLGEPERFINTKNIKKKNCNIDIRGKCLPTNDANTLYEKLIQSEKLRNFDAVVRELTAKGGDFEMQATKDFEKVRARKLRPDEFTFDPKLGFISCNFQLRPNQVLGVAFTYKYNGKEYKVGELASNAPGTDVRISVNATPSNPDSLDAIPQMLFVKLLKGTMPRLDIPLWDLMMKNVYSLGAGSINKEGFRLDVVYNEPGKGKRSFLPDTKVAGQRLLNVFNLDKLNVQGDPQPDGVFDFVEGITINTRQGKIIFPVLEPFGKALSSKIDSPYFARKYVYQQLYDTTITAAREFPELNVFSIEGEYKGTSNSEYSLGSFNLPKGSIKVTAGGQPLVEGTDYEVNLNIGTVKILNEAYINSSIPVNISFEDNQLFGFDQRRMFGTRWDYTFNKHLAIGGTFMKLWQVPFTQKVNVGEDPVSNSVYGLDINYSKDAPWVTKLVDKLPFINTKVPSSISFTAEGAFLKPGQAKAIRKVVNPATDEVLDEGGVVYVDDFEGSTNGTDLRQPFQWFLASVPQNDLDNNNPLFPESGEINSFKSNANRAKLAWYVINEQGNNSSFGQQASNVRTQADGEDPNFGFLSEQELFPLRGQSNQAAGTFPSRIFDLSYFPDERGPYNFDEPGAGFPGLSKGLDPNGRLNNPETRWGGIMRALPYNDFEASNVEFIDLWVMSPFLVADQSRFNSGKLHIDLGNISEDILRDSRQFYENGLPGGNNSAASKFPTDETTLARVPRITPITNAFENDNLVREAQDVGLDGWNDNQEKAQFSDYLSKIQNGVSNQTARTNILNDPSNDNFSYFLTTPNNSFTNQDGVKERYKNFNNPEGNSRASTTQGVESSTNLPDSEDLDNNKSLDNEGESYFHYEIPIEFDKISGTNPGGMNIDKAGFVSDIIKIDQGVKSRWKSIDQGAEPVFYRIRIPIDQFKKKVGGIQDFRSIRFMRMYMTGFKTPIVLRFARMELARSQWRRYKRNASVGEPSIDPGTSPSKDLTTFDINAINIEENGNRPDFKYVLPPGIVRETVLGQQLAQLQNEQAISMGVCDLPSESERGIYKITNFDMRLYKRLKMFVHAEERKQTTIPQGQLTAYIRLGNDFERNYYEYEIPLTMSDQNKLPSDYTSQAYAEEIWLKANRFDIDLERLVQIKTQRDRIKFESKIPYGVSDNGRDSIFIKGSPNLGQVKSIMIGIRNRSQGSVCAELWVNELRLNGFDKQGGGAGLARLDIKAADLGRATFSANYTGSGYGGIEQRQQQRIREDVLQYDATTNIELGRFLSDKSRVKIPFTYQYSNTTRTPEYDPYDLDVKLKQKLAEIGSDKKDALRKQSITLNEVTNMSFDNVRIERKADDTRKPMPWNISNFTISYQQTRDLYSDPIIEDEAKTVRRGQLEYNYALPNGASITPLKKLIKKDKYLKLFSEFNFSPLPSNFNFSTNLERQFNTTKYRFTDEFPELSTYYNKRFTWDRKYTMNWDLSKGIKLNYNADAASVIDEPAGLINTQEKKDSIWKNVRNLGRYKVFNQTIGANWTLPTKQIPLMDWVTIRAQAQATYNWNAAALNTQYLGNTIRNSQNRSINGDFNFEQLYNQWKYLKKINTPLADKGKKPKSTGTGKRQDAQPKSAIGIQTDGIEEGRGRVAEDKKTDAASSDDPRARLREKMKQGKVAEEAVKKAEGKTADAKDKTAEGKTAKDAKKKEKENKEYEPSMAERVIIRPLMLLRKGRVSYTENFQNTVPGFMPSTGILGQDNFSSPGWDFVLGQTPSDTWLDNAATNKWITTSNLLNESVVRNYSQQFQGNITIEPFTDFRIEVDIMKNYTKNHTQDFKKTDSLTDFAHLAPRDVGQFTVSHFSFDGLFGDKDAVNALYNKYSNYTKEVSGRLAGTNAKAHSAEPGYYAGYGSTNPEVAIPAFLAAYTGQDPNKVNLNVFNTIPLPNYRLNYNGLSKLKMFKKTVQSINITHAYKSQLQLSSYNTNTPDYDPTNSLRKDPINFNYYSALNIPGVVLNKEFSPLIGIDMKLKNDLSLRVDMKKRYNMQLTFSDNMLSEQKQDEYTIGFGYKMKNVHLKFLDFMNFEQPASKKKDGEKKNSIIKLNEDKKDDTPVELDKNGKPKKKKKVKKGNDLNLKMDISLNNSITQQTMLLTGLRQVTRGELTIRVSPSADYTVNKRLTLRFSLDYNSVQPFTSQSFPRTNITGLTTLRFQL
jgi:cell surface protein SprA